MLRLDHSAGTMVAVVRLDPYLIRGVVYHELNTNSSSDVLLSRSVDIFLIKSRACDAEMRSFGKNLVNPLITGRRTFKSGSLPWSSNFCSSVDSERCPFSPILISPFNCSHFGCHSRGNSPTKSIIDARSVVSKPLEWQCSEREIINL